MRKVSLAFRHYVYICQDFTYARNYSGKLHFPYEQNKPEVYLGQGQTSMLKLSLRKQLTAKAESFNIDVCHGPK